MLAKGTNTLRLDEITHGRHQICIRWSVDENCFETTYWYDTVDLDALEAVITSPVLDNILFHIALFEINKGTSLKPRQVDLGKWSPYLTQNLATLWSEVVRRVWAQWRYQHDDPEYIGPTLSVGSSPIDQGPLVRNLEGEKYLSFCGGGKDSLVAAQLLSLSETPYDSLVYSNSVYGRAEPQFAIIDRLLTHLNFGAVHRQWVFDDFVEAPIIELEPDLGIELLTSAETPSSIFASLPIVLAHGFTNIVLAHERSANVGNVIWSATGEDVNHQWGKSFEAETLLNAYIRDHLIADFSYFSVLQPIHDALIFAMLRKFPDAVPATHSCNIAKPWCMRCPKCAYVWINYKAWLPWDVVDPMFGDANLLDFPENQIHYRQMLGLSTHTPFECIGQIEESQLAFAMADKRGLTGTAMDVFKENVDVEQDWASVAYPFLTAHDGENGIPEHLKAKVLPIMKDLSESAQAHVRDLFQ
jgi:UDP-N-acetyl-alpha-D-muramoyl-L-alanyl-L-glutamate epimerase